MGVTLEQRRRDWEFLAALTPGREGGAANQALPAAAIPPPASGTRRQPGWGMEVKPIGEGEDDPTRNWGDAEGADAGYPRGELQLVAYQPSIGKAAPPSPAPTTRDTNGTTPPRAPTTPRPKAALGRTEALPPPAPAPPAYPGAPPLGAMTLSQLLGPVKTGAGNVSPTQKLPFLDDFNAFVPRARQITAPPAPGSASNATQPPRQTPPTRRPNPASPAKVGATGSTGPTSSASGTPTGENLIRAFRELPAPARNSPYTAAGEALKEAWKRPTVRFRESYGPPSYLQNKVPEQEVLRALRGEQPGGEGSYARIGRFLVAARKLPWQQRQAVERALAGEPLTLAEQRLADRGREQIAAELGEPFPAHELRRRALFGPGSINPRTLQMAGSPSQADAFDDAFEHLMVPNERAATEQSYEVYRDKAARKELAAPPAYSDNPQFRALQEQDLARVRAWVKQNHFGISGVAAEKDLSNPAVQRELAAQLASKDPRTRYTDLAAQKHRYLAQLGFLSGPDAARQLGLKTHFGRQLLKAMVDERRTHLPTLHAEDEKGVGDVKVAIGAMGAGMLAEMLVAEGLASAPALVEALGPTAKALPATVSGGVEAGIQQVGTEYVGGERRPGELLKSFVAGGALGALGGFLFGHLPAGEMSAIERTQATRALERTTEKLEGLVGSLPAFSRERRDAIAELRRVRAKQAELLELGHQTLPRQKTQPVRPDGVPPGIRRSASEHPSVPPHGTVPTGRDTARFQAPVEPAAPATGPRLAGAGVTHGEAGAPHGTAGGQYGLHVSPTSEPIHVQVDPEGRIHVGEHGAANPEDAAALAALDEAHRRGGPDARARLLHTLSPEQRSRLASVMRELEERGAPGNAMQTPRERGAGQQGASAETPTRTRLTPVEPDPAAEPHGVRETPEPAAGGDAGQGRATEDGGPYGSDRTGVRRGPDERVRPAAGKLHTPEGARLAVEAELETKTQAWHERHGGKFHGPKPSPEVVHDALEVARSLVRAGARTEQELVRGLKQQLGAGQAGDFYRTVTDALERDALSGGTRGGGLKARPGGLGDGVADSPSLPVVDGTSSLIPPEPRPAPEEARAGAIRATEPSSASGPVAAPEVTAGGTATGIQSGPESEPARVGSPGSASQVRWTGYGQENRVFTPEQADAARGRLAPRLPELQAGQPVERFKQVRSDLLELGSFHYEAGARRLETWRARLQAEIGADTLSKTQLNELWRATKTRTNKALNVAARDGLPPPPSPTLSRSASPTAPEFSSGAVAVSARPAAPRRAGSADGEALLAQAASLPGALQNAPATAGGRGGVRWYEVGQRPEARAQREAMYAHLVGQRPELASGTWSVPGYGKGTLRMLLVEQGVVPAELADRYALAGAKARPSGGRARQEAARAKAPNPAYAYASATEGGGGGPKPETPGGGGAGDGWEDPLPASGGGGNDRPPSGEGGKPPSGGDEGGDQFPFEKDEGDGKPRWEPHYSEKENGDKWRQGTSVKRGGEARRWAEEHFRKLGEDPSVNPKLYQRKYRAKVVKHLRRLFKTMIPFRRFEEDALLALLKGERLKSMFEMKKSSGALDIDRRARVEQQFWGIPDKNRDLVRPSYGYLHSDESGRVLGDEDWTYGDIAVRFKSDILERTTFTGGDSLDQVSVAGSKNPRYRVVPDPFHHPSWLAFPKPLGDVLQYETAEELVQAMHAAHPRLDYIEAQYHGDVTLADVQEVIFLKKPPSEGPLRQMHDEIRQRLTEKGIPYQEAWKTKNDG